MVDAYSAKALLVVFRILGVLYNARPANSVHRGALCLSCLELPLMQPRSLVLVDLLFMPFFWWTRVGLDLPACNLFVY